MSPMGTFENTDPLEAIFALNIGDFVAENLISDDLLKRISDHVGKHPKKLEAQLEELIQLYSIDKTLALLGLDDDRADVLYDSVAQTLVNMFQARVCYIFQLSHQETGKDFLSLTGTSVLRLAQSKGFLPLSTQPSDPLYQIYQGDGPVVVEQGLSQFGASYPFQVFSTQEKRPDQVLLCPLKEAGKRLGLLVFEFDAGSPLVHPESVNAAQAVAMVFVAAIRLQGLLVTAQHHLQAETAGNHNDLLSLRAQITEQIADLSFAQQRFLECLAEVVDARQAFTRGHSKRVAQLGQLLAESLKLNEKTVELVYFAGLLGGLGKVDVPTSFLSKPGSLTPDEQAALMNHPNVGVQLLGNIHILSEVTPYVQSLQERWDGSGQPEGLSGRSIPLGSRILAVADAYHAMTEPRPYRETPLSHEKALEQLQQEAGVKWDPTVVGVLTGLPEVLCQSE